MIGSTMTAPGRADWSAMSPSALIDDHYNRRESTARAYRADMKAFRRYLEATTPGGCPCDEAEAASALLEGGRGAAQRLADGYRRWLELHGNAPNTIRRRLGSLLGLARLAGRYEVVPWSMEVRLPEPSKIRDTRGPRRDEVLDMLAECQRRGDAKGARDLTLLCLLFHAALRASEVISLDVANVDIAKSEVWVYGKGGALFARERVEVPLITKRAIAAWIGMRGTDDGPLFRPMRGGEERLSYRGLYGIVREIGKRVGVKVWPHGLRHAATTEALRCTRGNVPLVMRLTRHKHPGTLLIYQDAAGEGWQRAVGEIVAAGQVVEVNYGAREGTADKSCYL